jgi:hypothetical protein
LVEVKAAKEFRTEKINNHSIITQLNSFHFRLEHVNINY